MFRYIFFVVVFLFATNIINVGADQTYVVKKGDNLNKISKKFGVSVKGIQEENNLQTIALKPGAKLRIPVREATGKKQGHKSESSRASGKKSTAVSMTSTEASDTTESLPSFHIVKKGETLLSIARKYSVSRADLAELNNIKKSAKLSLGKHLVIRRDGPMTYVVRQGDTLWRIAAKFDISTETLIDLNDLDSEDVHPGQKLILEVWNEDMNDRGSLMASEGTRISDDITALTVSSELGSIGVKDRLALFAKKMLNIPYRFGGSTFMGIDCSGYVQKVFGFLNVPLPRTAREQYHVGESVNKEDLSIGDLVFFRTYASFPSHVGIYLGNNLFIHASSRNKKVAIDSLDTPYYFKRFIGAKRLFEDGLDENVDKLEKS